MVNFMQLSHDLDVMAFQKTMFYLMKSKYTCLYFLILSNENQAFRLFVGHPDIYNPEDLNFLQIVLLLRPLLLK